MAAVTDGVTRLDVDKLARSGPSETAPCARCESPTRSHVLLYNGEEWDELARRDPLEDVEAGTRVRFLIVCHSCLEELDLPASNGEFIEQCDDEQAFGGVVG